MYKAFTLEWPDLDVAKAEAALSFQGQGLYFKYEDVTDPNAVAYVCAYALPQEPNKPSTWRFECFTLSHKPIEYVVDLHSARDMACFCSGYMNIADWALMVEESAVEVWTPDYEAMLDAVPEYIMACVEHIDADYSWQDFRTWYANNKEKV